MEKITLDNGFVKATTKNVPQISSEMIFSYILSKHNSFENRASVKWTDDAFINYVQIRKSSENCVLKGYVSKDYSKSNDLSKVLVAINYIEGYIKATRCETCGETNDTETLCNHVIEFLFWLHRNTTLDKSKQPEYKVFWHMDTSTIENSSLNLVILKNHFPKSEHYDAASKDEVIAITPEDDYSFLYSVMDEMEKFGLQESEIYIHCRPLNDEFEPLFIHHTMLDNANNCVKDFKSFIMHMEDVGANGIFQRIFEVSAMNYKKKLWMETQYCRIRCSLLYAVQNRQDSSIDDKKILEEIFCTNRNERIEEKKAAKEHKRFILKQTEKLENKEYKECGLLINETYPYICAAPDGITDDHIVEIKVPKTDEEFEKYLIGKENIAPKYMAQLQIQMYLSNVQKALYCVLNPNFEVNGAMHYVWVKAELQQIANLLSAAEDFWKEIVFPEIKRIYDIED